MPDKSLAITILRFIGWFLPGNYLKTFFYIHFVAKPRKVLRLMLNGFYRMEHINDVLAEVKQNYSGRFSILEFGTNKGYSFTKMLYATKYHKMSDRVTVHAFDSFTGFPVVDDRRNINIITNEVEWRGGEPPEDDDYSILNEYCSSKYKNFKIHKGFFEESLTEEFLESLLTEPPILIWLDCDYYTSTRFVIEKIVSYIPNGCVIYFDEFEVNYGSRFAGESRVVHEVNQGLYGEGIELILDTALSLDSQRVYRFVRLNDEIHYKTIGPPVYGPGRFHTNDSLLP